MKSETTDNLLKFILFAFVILAVIFALQVIFRTRELNQLGAQAGMINNNRLLIQSLYGDTLAYSQKNPSPDLTRILQTLQAKPPAGAH